jgi:uridine monophosphate synthetase
MVDKPLIYPRKEVKSYGTGRAVEGIYTSGDKVVVIEDLVTTGGSVLTAIEPLTAAGLEVEDVVVLIDREQGGGRHLAEAGYRLHVALNVSEILDTLRQAGRISEEAFGRVKSYLGPVSQ